MKLGVHQNNLTGIYAVCFVVGFFIIPKVFSQVPILTAGNPEKLKQETSYNVKAKLQPLLEKYCLQACEIISIQVETSELLDDENVELGFESLSEGKTSKQFYVKDLVVDIQVDDRVSTSNRDRMQTILLNHLKSFGLTPVLQWKAVKLPVFGTEDRVMDQLKLKLESKIQQILQSTYNLFCPEQCLTSQIQIMGSDINSDEAKALPKTQVFRGENANEIMRVDDVQVFVEMDEALGESTRNKIEQVIQSKLKFVSPLRLDVTAIAFPEAMELTKKKNEEIVKDPFQLDKLRQMLTMFKELASTKEIITTTKESSSAQSSSELSLKENQQSIEKSQRVDSHSSDSVNQSSSQNLTQKEWYAILGVAALVFLLFIALLFKTISNQKNQSYGASSPYYSDARPLSRVSNEASSASTYNPRSSASHNGEIPLPPVTLHAENLAKSRLKTEQLKESIITKISTNPKAARFTFGRMIREDGIEVTAKYLKLLGEIVVMELLDDPSLKRYLFDLSEFYHGAQIQIGDQESLDLLDSLSAKIMASELKVLVNKGSEGFEFLSKLTITQIFDLMRHEQPKIQAAVLAQLDANMRSQVFGMFAGSAKNQLMAELCKDEAYPREYLRSLAQALKHKVSERPEFNAEKFDQSSLVIEVLERSSIQEQKAILASVQNTNPAMARSLKEKLVSLNTLLFVRDGILLELIIGFNREDLIALFSRMPQQIRDHILMKAPRELAASWYEDLQGYGVAGEDAYKRVENALILKIKNFAQAGQINLTQVNDMMFASGANSFQSASKQNTALSDANTPKTMISTPVSKTVAA